MTQDLCWFKEILGYNVNGQPDVLSEVFAGVTSQDLEVKLTERGR